jgi:peptide/nickel transport system substrate-binding protein
MDEERDTLTRRRLLTYGGQGLALVGAGSLLAACGSGGGQSATATGGSTSLGGGKPVQGGRLTVGMISGGSTETIDPATAVTFTDILREYQLYDYLFQPGKGPDFHTVEPRLATSAEPNQDATVWTIKLRQGVTWHDGRPFTADDVVWSVRSWGQEGNYAYFYIASFIDFKKVRKLDKYTVEIPLLKPTAQLPTMLMIYNLAVIPNGATPEKLAKEPVGTGPFKFVSFTPGSQSVFARNPDYWEGGGKPYVDELVVDSSFQDDNSRYNALLGGQIDVSPLFPANYARQQQSSGQVNVLSSSSAQAYAFSFRIDEAPFDDVRVRQAMKLLTDRQALIDGVFPGYGQIGNDVFGSPSQYFASDLKAEYDPEKAKSLLKAAGAENLSVTLPVSAVAPGFVEAGTLFAQQAAAVGVKVDVEQVSAATYYSESGGYMTRTAGEVNTAGYPSMTAVASALFLKGAPYDETYWASQPGGGNQQLMDQAIAEQDPQKAEELWHEVQTEWFEKDGHVVWSYLDWIDAAGKDVAGLSAGIASPLNNWRLLDGWKTA